MAEAHRDDRLGRAQKRNAQRIRDANKADLNIIGEFFPPSPSCVFNCRILGPDDFSPVPREWVEKIIKAARAPCPTPRLPDIRFDTRPESLRENARLLELHDWDLPKLLESQRNTTMWHGSEFRPRHQLEPIIGDHPNFESLLHTFENGMDYHFVRELNETERADELSAQLERGNHKSAKGDPEHLEKLLEKDVRHGFSFPIPAEDVHKVKGGMVQPCGLAIQHGMKADGERYLKKRLTHDLTYSITGDDVSVNARVDMAQYPEMVYGWCLFRVIHFIVWLRVRHPTLAIMACKFDYSDAYWKVSHAGRAAACTMLVVLRIVYVMLRLSFGGSPNPPTFCEFSELLTDLANELLAARIDPEEASSPTVDQSHVEPVTEYDDDEPFAAGIAPAVEVPTPVTARVDCFVDDLILIFLATMANLRMAPHAVPLAVHAVSRPHAGDDEPIPRRQLLEPSKLMAEGRPTERLVVLGWLMDTRRMLVSLPKEKFRAWAEDLQRILSAGETTVGELETTIGRLNHAAYLIPLSRHFLNRVRNRIPIGRRRKHQALRLGTMELDDLRLWDKLLVVAHEGISMNLLTLRVPTRVGWSDSCPFGLGGYTQKGRAWRLKVPPEANFFGDDTVNNVLEFLALAITAILLMDEAEEEGERFPCLLSLADSTSAIGWVFRSSRLGKNSPYRVPVTFIARHLAQEVTRRSAQLTTQHIRGSFNDVADLLSFEGKERGYTNPLTHDRPADDLLTNRILSSYPQLVTEGFAISPLPPKVLSFACQALQIVEASWTPSKRSLGRKGSDAGEGGSGSSRTSTCVTLTSIQFRRKGSASSPSVSSCATVTENSTKRVDMLGSVRSQWWSRLSEVPLAMWLRRSGQLTGRVPSTTREAWPARTGYEPN